VSLILLRLCFSIWWLLATLELLFHIFSISHFPKTSRKYSYNESYLSYLCHGPVFATISMTNADWSGLCHSLSFFTYSAAGAGRGQPTPHGFKEAEQSILKGQSIFSNQGRINKTRDSLWGKSSCKQTTYASGSHCIEPSTANTF
jgi:hypothetical protein